MTISYRERKSVKKRMRYEMKNVAFRGFGAGVMNNNLLLLPGRAINTQLAPLMSE